MVKIYGKIQLQLGIYFLSLRLREEINTSGGAIMTHIGIRAFRILMICCVVSIYTPIGLSQGQTTGAIQGRVYDIDSGAGVAGATVTVRNQDLGLERSTVTGSDGSYTLNILPPGAYTITATHPQYEADKSSELSEARNFAVRLSTINQVQQRLIGLRKIGAVSQTPGNPTTPPTTPPTAQPGTQPQTQPATQGGESQGEQLTNTVSPTRIENFDTRQLVSLPLASTRTFDDLAFLAAGVAPPPQAIGQIVGPGVGAGVGTSGQFSVNGARSRSNNFTVDGSDNNDPDVGVRRQGFVTLIPQPIESVQAFAIATLLWDAEFGRNLGSQVNAVSKGGGNEFHGQLYGFFTDSSLNARNFFDYTGGDSGGKNPFTRTLAGFALGGPVTPNSTQFFGSFEHENINSSTEQHFATPTLAQRGFGNAQAILVPLINNNLGIIPGGVTPSGSNAFSFYPLPNNPGGPYGANTLSRVLPSDGDGVIASLKVSRQVTPGSTLNVRYNFTNDERILPSVNRAINSTIEADSQTQNLSVTLDSSLKINLFNQARFSFGRTRLDFLPYANTPFIFDSTSSGVIGVVDSGGNLIAVQPFSSSTGPLGQVTIEPFSPVGVDVFIFPQKRVNNTFQFADTLAMNWRTHSYKFGADIRRIQFNSLQDRNYRPSLVFGIGTFANATLTNQGLFVDRTLFVSQGADLASLGLASSIFQSITAGVPNSTIGLRAFEYNFFFNDNWRIRPNFSLDYGLRYEYNTVPSEVNNRIEDAITLKNLPVPGNSRFDTPSRTAAFNNAVSAYRAVLDGRTGIYDPDRNNFAPHVGFAWDPWRDGKTSIRAGYGLYYDAILGAVVSQSRNVFPNEIPFNIDPSFAGFDILGNLLNPAFLVLNGDSNAPLIRPGTINQFGLAPEDFVAGIGQLFVQNSAAGLAFTLPEKHLRTPYAQQWHLTLEREILRDYLLSAGYVGTKGTKLTRLTTPNFGPNVIPFAGFVDANTAFPLFLFGQSLAPTRPNQNLGAYQIFENSANSSYHSLQLEMRKRYTHGYTFTAAYTWSHAIDDVSDVFPIAGAPVLPQDSFNLNLERADANFDARHRFVSSLIWDLPFYRNSTDDAARWLGGWQLSSIFQVHTGQPFTLNVPFDANFDGNLTDRPSTTQGLIFNDDHGPQRVRLSDGSSFLNFINTTGGVFINGRGFIDGLINPGTGFVGRNTVRGDTFINLDMVFSKNFKFTESQNLEFRTEVFNILNRANFGIPIRVIGAPGFGSSVDTVNPARVIQFALKYKF